MKTLRFFSATLAIAVASTGIAVGQCVIDNDDFATQDGGCKDLSTGLVFGPDTRAIGIRNQGGSSAFSPKESATA